MPKPSRYPDRNLFSGYHVEEIMHVCVVSKATAQHFKRGSRSPSPQAERLWQLHAEGRILGVEWGRYRVHRDELIDPDGLVYKAGEIATLPFLHAQIAELRKQLDKARHTESLGHLGFFEVTDALRGVLEDGARLLKAVEKIPRRTALQPRPRQDSGLDEQPSDPTVQSTARQVFASTS